MIEKRKCVGEKFSKKATRGPSPTCTLHTEQQYDVFNISSKRPIHGLHDSIRPNAELTHSCVEVGRSNISSGSVKKRAKNRTRGQENPRQKRRRITNNCLIVNNLSTIM
jgi:hypothetical protein